MQPWFYVANAIWEGGDRLNLSYLNVFNELSVANIQISADNCNNELAVHHNTAAMKW